MRKLVPVFLLLGATLANAADQWSLRLSGRQTQLVHSTGAGDKTVAAFDSVTVFGSDHSRIALITSNLDSPIELVVVDRGTEQVGPRWPLKAVPASQLSGATDEIVLIDEYAYFPVYLLDAGTGGAAKNELGGIFELGRMSLKDGKLETFAMPAEALNPHVTKYDGLVYVSSDDRAQHAWTFDADRKKFVILNPADRSRLAMLPRRVPEPSARQITIARNFDEPDPSRK